MSLKTESISIERKNKQKMLSFSSLTKKKALWQSQWRPCGKFAAALPQTHYKVAAMCFYHANEPSCRFAINLPQPCGKIIYVNFPLAKLRHSVTLHICFLTCYGTPISSSIFMGIFWQTFGTHCHNIATLYMEGRD